MQPTLHYHQLGHGSKVLLAFHGIGQDGVTCYQSFADQLGDIYTIYAFDLFFHGQNLSRLAGDIVTKEIWKNIIEHFLKEHKIERFDVAGYSMGGRFALATVEVFSKNIDKVFLIAPDGISEHPLYSLASRFPPTRTLFRWFMRNPNSFLKTAGVLKKVGVVNSSLFRFTENVINTPQKRNTILNSWIAFRKLRFDIPEVYETAKSNGVDIYLFIGKYDKLLKSQHVTKLSRLLPADRYFSLPSGHVQVVEKAAKIIHKLL